MIKLISLLFLVITSSHCTMKQEDKPLRTTVAQVDLELYAGKWFEIARYPHSFEKGLVGVTATYSLKPNGRIEVLNQGFKGSLNGKRSKAKAWAKVPNPLEPGKLKVYFFWPFGADYYILDLDENYQWALVGSSSMNYLWILSRTPQMPNEVYNQILKKVMELGYDIEKLELVEQPQN